MMKCTWECDEVTCAVFLVYICVCVYPPTFFFFLHVYFSGKFQVRGYSAAFRLHRDTESLH